MPDLQIDNLRKTFGGTVALDDVSVHAADGELLTLLGPSGCGKSTTLWSIAGLHRPDSGTIRVGGEVFFDGRRVALAPEDRNCGVVFQSYAVWPHMTVADNVGYPLKIRRVGAAQRRARVAEVLELVELGPYAARYPHELSGGQQQRVALARALAHPPQLLLLDEPFSNLDAKLRSRAREWLRLLQRRLGVTTVFVTHDQDEALSMSDRIVVMEHGRVRQIGTPEEVYRAPADRFVADFIGQINLLHGTASAAPGGRTAVSLPGLDRPVVVAGDAPAGAVELAIRPEVLTAYAEGYAPDGPNAFRAPVVDRSFLGTHYSCRVRLGDQTLVVRTTVSPVGDHVTVHVPVDGVRVFPAATTPLEENIDVPAL